MRRFLIYLFPAMIDMALGSVMFVCTVRMAESGATAKAVADVAAVWAITYMITCPVVGRLVTERNASRMLIGSSLAVTAVACAFVIVPALEAVYVIMVFQAAATAFFFAPFQVFMKQVDRGRSNGVARSTGLYTFAWSTGIACGPFVAGYVWKFAGWQWCHAINGVLGLLTVLGVVLLGHLAHGRRASSAGETNDAPRSAGDYASLPDLAWLGWVAVGVGCAALSAVRGVFPSSARALNISKPDQGTALALLGWTQAAVGLYMCRSRTWMYRAPAVAALGLFGFAGLILFGLAETPLGFYSAAVCIGVYSGSFFFYAVFHSLTHPSRSARYVSTNESVVGLGSIVGPLVGGRLAHYFSLSTPYFCAAAVVGVVILLQFVVHRRRPGRMPGPPATTRKLEQGESDG